MNRRSLIEGAAAACGLGLGLVRSSGTSGPGRGDAGSPNVIIVVLDDMSASDWKALPMIRQQVGSRGTVYPNFILNTPVCGPSRATLFTGLLPHNHGVTENREGDGRSWSLMNRAGIRIRTMHFAARQRGYRTGLAGKFLNGVPNQGAISPGLDSWAATTDLRYEDFRLNVDGEAVRYSGKSYLTDVLADHAVAFVESTPEDQPFLLYFTPKAPKDPATPSREFSGTYADAVLEQSPAFNEADTSDKPFRVRSYRQLRRAEVRRLENLERRRLETLSSVDAAFGRIWEAVRRAGRSDDTIVLVMSDNGYQMGDHRIVAKGQPYDRSVRVPMMASGPGFAAGVTDGRMVCMADIAPTLSRLLGLGMRNLDGAALMDPWQRAFVPIHVPGTVSPFWALRGASELYVERESGEREYYDYVTDPWELENQLADWEGHVPTLAPARAAALSATLAGFRTCSGPTCRGITP